MLTASKTDKLSTNTVHHLQSLILTHRQCRVRCNRSLQRVKDPLARAELRRLSAMHYHQALELEGILSSYASSGQSCSEGVEIGSMDCRAFGDGEESASDVLEQVSDQAEDTNRSYRLAISDARCDSVARTLHRHCEAIGVARTLLENITKQPAPI